MSNPKDTTTNEDDMLPEYDFTGKQAIRGKYYQRLRQGYTLKVEQADGTVLSQTIVRPEGTVLLDPDVQEFFPDAEAVNNALRALIHLIPVKKTQQTPS